MTYFGRTLLRDRCKVVCDVRRVHHVHHRTDDSGGLNLCRCALKSELFTALRTKCCCCFAFYFSPARSGSAGSLIPGPLLESVALLPIPFESPYHAPCPSCISSPVNFHSGFLYHLVFPYKTCPFEDTKPTATVLSLQRNARGNSLYYSLKIRSQIAHSRN